jgi:hypothetical protein
LELLKTLRHPHLLPVFGAWQTEEFLIVGMELADRTLLDRWREAHDQGLSGIPRDELLEYFRQAARGLDYLNEPRRLPDGKTGPAIQHRDVKPQNLLLVAGSVRVADFGLARVLSNSMTSHTGCCTLAYAAPEFFQGRTARQSDQYSLAATWCHLRGGRPPFEGTPAAVMGGHVSRPPDLSMLPEEERPIVARALAKRPQRRWPNCGAFVDALSEPKLTRRTWVGATVGTIAAGAAFALAVRVLPRQSATSLIAEFTPPEAQLRNSGNPRPRAASLIAEFTPPVENFGPIRGLAFSQDEQFVVTNSSSGQPWVWSMKKFSAQFPLQTLGGPGVALTGNYVEPNILTGGEQGNVEHWSLKTGQLVMSFRGFTESVSSVAFSPRATRIIAGGTDNAIRIWESTGEQLPPLVGSADCVMSICLLPSQFRLLAASGDGLVRLWNLNSRSIEQHFEGHQGPLWSISCSADGRKALSSGEDGTIRLWDISTGRQLRRLECPGGKVMSVLSADGRRALSTAPEGRVVYWDLEHEKTICDFIGSSAPVEALAFTPDQQSAITGSETLRLWRLPSVG